MPSKPFPSLAAALLAALIPSAAADIDARAQGIDRPFTVQYVCVQDFHQCITGIGQDLIFSTPAYAQAHTDCCTVLQYCDDIADHEDELMRRSGHQRRGLFLVDILVLECSADVAESRRAKRMAAWRSERRLSAPETD